MSTINLGGFSNRLEQDNPIMTNAIQAIAADQITDASLDNLLTNSSVSRLASAHYKKSKKMFPHSDQLVSDLNNGMTLIVDYLGHSNEFALNDKILRAILMGTIAMESGFNPLAIAYMTSPREVEMIYSDPPFYFDQMRQRAKGLVQFVPSTYSSAVKNFFSNPAYKRWNDYVLNNTLESVIKQRDHEFYTIIKELGHPTTMLADHIYSQYYPTLQLFYETIRMIQNDWDFDPVAGWKPKSPLSPDKIKAIWSPAPFAFKRKDVGFAHLFNLYHMDGIVTSSGFKFHSSSFLKDYVMRLSLQTQLM